MYYIFYFRSKQESLLEAHKESEGEIEENKNKETIEYVNLEVNAQDMNGWTPLISIIMAKFDKREEIIKALIKLGADPFLMSEDGKNAFHWATRIGCKNTLELLIDGLPSTEIHRMLNTSTENELKMKPLFIAARFDQVGIFEYILSLEQKNRKT